MFTKHQSKKIYSSDDSSDEWDNVENYNIIYNLTEFKKKFSDTEGWQEHQSLELSFITHAAGIYIFYSKVVQEKYYELKKSKLSQDSLTREEGNFADIEKHNTQLATEYKNRKTLGDNPEINIESLGNEEDNIAFLAYLRLHNRSEKRHLKNCGDGNIAKERTTEWQNKSCIISKINKDLNSNYSRSEEIKYINTNENYSYKQLYCIYEQPLNGSWKVFLTKNKIPTKDDDICIFYYHLFGCETIKNPAAFIHNKMVIDLIKNDKMSWQDALCGRKLPMTMSGAIKASRVINSDYSEFMPHKYLYDNKDYHSYLKVDVQNFLKKETNITTKWLTWKLGKSIANYMIKNCCEKKEGEEGEAVKAIYELILEASQEWYPGVLGEVEAFNHSS